MTIADFDHFDLPRKKELLFSCCGSDAWVKSMLGVFPVNDLVDLLEYAEEKWFECSPAEWLEAFHQHPRIGDPESPQTGATGSSGFAAGEQSAVADASPLTLDELTKANEEYEENFGYIFIVFATGKTAEEILDILKTRVHNDPGDELQIAGGEQNKITQLRLQKLFV
jgi:2-oxo-4-hydroxy-4-carboxy-5-ureidoimidazoline decarboxylase